MSIKATMMVLGSATVLAAAALVACSSSSKGGGGTNPLDSGTGSKGDSSTASDGGTSSADTGTVSSDGSSPPPSDGGSGSDCESPPAIFAETAAGVYCPYSGVDGGKTMTCAADQHCCETPESANTPSTCNPIATPCAVAMSSDWQCLGAIDCAAIDASTPVCCGTGTMMPVANSCTPWSEPSSFTGTTCAASCTTYVLCNTTADCTAADAGTTCSATKAGGSDFGYCTP